ncbi:hypothetical protein [Winogradskyella bathintestinalis]|uniref:ApeA N-terminal domain-containing protein n=1 Tax=Winogradskyella bathintestinalis TaxID=3035208 RepID=A0ABT7ZZ04_9FLAO|nr:hypothetical protein [Winogradskyella bathintestinalis]MDN3494240.1 hypothetical protein [Winogradskyella bathintestinalis]
MNNIKNSPLYFLEYQPNVTYADGNPVEHKNLVNRSTLSNELVVMVQDHNGEKVTFTSRTVNYQDKIFIAPLPNPVHILLNSGIENYNQSVTKLGILRNDCQLDNKANGIHILNIGIDNTNSNFNDLVKFKMMSVISLVTSLEAFLNQIISNDFMYEQTRNGKSKKLNKKKIESPQVTFKEKLTLVINQLLENPDFSKENEEIIERITELYDLRREVIHLKTYSENEMGLYFKSIGKLLDIELENIIISIKKYMNLIKPEFVE